MTDRGRIAYHTDTVSMACASNRHADCVDLAAGARCECSCHRNKPPQQFEDLRKFLSTAVDQLLVDMQQQSVDYALADKQDALELLRRVAKVQEMSSWHVWEAWALRHALPIHDMVPAPDVTVMRKRLYDLLGYCVLGLLMCEKEQQ